MEKNRTIFDATYLGKTTKNVIFLGWSHLGAHDVIMTSHCRFSTLDSSGLHILLEEYINNLKHCRF